MADDPTKPRADARARKATGGGKAARPRLWSGVFVLLILLTFCCFLTSQGMNAGTAVYVTELGGTAAYAGFLMAVFPCRPPPRACSSGR